MSAAAVIILRRKKFVRRFKELGATSPERAVPFAEVGMRRSWVFDRMISRGVFVATGDDRFYVNEEAADAFLAAQRRRVRVVGGMLLVAFVIVLLASIRW
ncbi:MAG TPA: hypothetical protein PKJ98_04825 [Verrucomicrobiota bacterium]|nr:hypothetical protein [Verrucomicrobiota bacterium]